jgi:hypothetical protein
MRLYEFAGTDPIITKLVVLSDQLKSAVDSGEIQGEWTTEQLLNFLSANGVNVDEPDIFDMVKKPPLSKVISNINNDVVTFKGNEQPDLPQPDQNQSQQVVQQMAKSAMK